MTASLLIAAADTAQDEALTWGIVGVIIVVLAVLFVAWAQWVGRERED